LGKLDLELFGLELECIIRNDVIDKRALFGLFLETLADDVTEGTVN